MTPQAQKIEALLFLAGEAVNKDELARLVACQRSEIDSFMDELLAARQGHGVTLLVTDTHAQLVTSPEVANYVTQFIHGETKDISAAAAETLAIIAYRGPISRHEIDAIRGVDSRRMIRQLIARGLIRKDSSKKNQTRYSVAEEFLQTVGLRQRQDLPNWQSLSTAEGATAWLADHELTNN